MELRDITKEAVTIGEDASFKEALSLMVSKQTNSLLVVNDEGKLSGEVGVSGLLDAIVPEYLDGDGIAAHFATEDMFKDAVEDAADMPVREFMTVEVNAVRADEGLMSVAATAIAQGRASVPVVDHDNRPVGVISRRGLKHILAKYLHIEDPADNTSS